MPDAYLGTDSKRYWSLRELDKLEFICFKQDEAISILNDKSLKFLDKFTYLGSNISSTEIDIKIRMRNGMNYYRQYINYMEIPSLW